MLTLLRSSMYRNSILPAVDTPSLENASSCTQSRNPAAASAGPENTRSANDPTTPAAMFGVLLSDSPGIGNATLAAPPDPLGSSCTCAVSVAFPACSPAG